MIETIWSFSEVSCGREVVKNFVQKVLQRSKTRYLTLQAALYYLILIQSHIRGHGACGAMQCGRRMFLAALILASKYLQDRNFSTRAWSTISGLKTCEINSNELTFLWAVHWKLHIPELVFHQWTDIVLRHSSTSQVKTTPSLRSVHSWKSIIQHLTPDIVSSVPPKYPMTYDTALQDLTMHEMPVHSGSNEPTPSNPYNLPRSLEPQSTPKTGTLKAPAVSALETCPR